MARTKLPSRGQTDPRWVIVQMQVRVPWWRQQQLQAEAMALGVRVPDLIADALDRIYPPEPPSA